MFPWIFFQIFWTSKYAFWYFQNTKLRGARPPKIRTQTYRRLFKPLVGPNSQQNHLLGKNDSAIGVRQPQMTRLNQILRANQQEMGMQTYQMLGAQQTDVSKMQPGQLTRWNNQQGARQTSLLYTPFKACELSQWHHLYNRFPVLHRALCFVRTLRFQVLQLLYLTKNVNAIKLQSLFSFDFVGFSHVAVYENMISRRNYFVRWENPSFYTPSASKYMT